MIITLFLWSLGLPLMLRTQFYYEDIKKGQTHDNVYQSTHIKTESYVHHLLHRFQDSTMHSSYFLFHFKYEHTNESFVIFGNH